MALYDVNYDSLSSSLLTVEEVYKDNLTVSTYLNSQTLDVSLDGYTPIGIVGWRVANASSSGANSSYISVFRAEISGTTLTYALRNHADDDAKVKITFLVLYA